MILLLTIGIGTGISQLLNLTGVSFPASVGAMLASSVIVNISGDEDKLRIPQAEIKLLAMHSYLFS